MKRYSFCITFTSMAYATNDTTIIHHVYKPDFAVCVPFCPGRKLGLVCHQTAAVFGLVFFQVNDVHCKVFDNIFYHLPRKAIISSDFEIRQIV